MSALKRLLGRIAFAALLLASFAWLYMHLFWPSTFLDVPELTANLTAKEVCSCVFVVGQTEEYCTRTNRQILTPSAIRIDREKKQVYARMWTNAAGAKWAGPYLGCVTLQGDFSNGGTARP